MAVYNNENCGFHHKRDINLEIKIENRIGKNIVPGLMVEIFEVDPNAIIIFRNSSDQRQGSSEHIILDHKHQIDDNFLNAFSKSLRDPESIEKIGLNKRGQKRYELSTYFGESSRSKNRHLYFTIVIDQIDSKTFEIVTAYPKPKNKKRD